MIKFWKSLSYATRFSAIAFIITACLGIMSMGFLGLGLYFLVSFLFSSYFSLDDLHGDAVWPAIIAVGVFWSLGFLIAGYIWHLTHKIITSVTVLRFIYILVVWLWAAFLWAIILRSILP
jgi:hypothetical protein